MLRRTRAARDSEHGYTLGGAAGILYVGDWFMQRKGFGLDHPAPLPIRETRYGFLYVETADVYPDGRRKHVKRTPYWKLLDDDDDEDDDDERQTERRSVYRRDYTVNHRPQ